MSAASLTRSDKFIAADVNICSSLNRPLTHFAVYEAKDTVVVGCVMSKFLCGFRAGFAARVALTSAAAGLLAGCASSERLSDPLSNPFQTASAGNPSSAPDPVAAAPVSPVQSRPLSAPSPAANARPSPSIAVTVPRSGQTVAGWSAQGGTPVVVAQGETVQSLSNRYGVPVDALVRANGFASASQIQPGTRIVIPVYNAALAASSGAGAANAPAPAKTAAPAKAPKEMGAPPRSLASQAGALKAASRTRDAKAGADTQTASLGRGQAEKLQKNAPAQKISATGSTAPAAESAPAKQTAPLAAKAETAKDGKAVARAETQAAAPEPQKASATESANPEFRWPARGRIIQAFKQGSNDGINIALPEGTSIKAAESGVVAYAGNELKGYGNLILIRHPNGFVSAYANTGEIEVKRGDTVKRGQTIAKSGQSGNVSTPQLHFELRKGTMPVDPTQYLAGV